MYNHPSTECFGRDHQARLRMSHKREILAISDRYLLSQNVSSQPTSPSATLNAFESAAIAADCESLRAGFA
jgi:hypothetical protein